MGQRGGLGALPTPLLLQALQTLGLKGPLEVGMAIQSSILAWRILWTEEYGGLQSMMSQRAGHN